MDQIILNGMVFKSHIGVYQKEKDQGQHFQVDLILDLGYIEASDSDDLIQTVSYGDIFRLLEAYFASADCDLIEYAAGQIIEQVLAFDRRITAVDLTLKKPEAPIDGDFSHMAVRLRRRRSERVYLALGANLGDPVRQLQEAVRRLKQVPGLAHLRSSSFYSTVPWGVRDQNMFVNAVVAFDYSGSPFRLLDECQKIEREMGRIREEKWGPRIIDLDLILFGDLTIDHPRLKLPHPYYLERDFVLIPLRELRTGVIAATKDVKIIGHVNSGRNDD